MMKLYELTLLISPELTEQELNTLEEKLVNLVEKEGGILVEKTKPIRKQLPSPVKKKSSSFLLSINCKLEADSSGSLRQKLEAEPEILRCAFLAAKHPSASRQKVSREESFAWRKKEERGKVEIGQIEKKLEEILNTD